MKMDAIIFDLDGTLWNSSDSIMKAWNKVFAERHINYVLTKDKLKNIFGKTNDVIANECFPNLSLKERTDVINACALEEVKVLNLYGGKLYDNISETLKDLHKEYKLMIVSNCQEGYIEAFLNYHKLNDCFDDIECNGKTGLDKAGNIKLIIERNQIKRAIYVGDTIIDYESAKDNNIPFIRTTYGFGKFYCKYKIDNFKDIKKIIKEIEKDTND